VFEQELDRVANFFEGEFRDEEGVMFFVISRAL